MPSVELIQIIMPAIFAGIMVAITHAPLGIEVLKRGIIFIDLAVAQIAGLGLVIVGHEPLWLSQITALAFALAAAMFFRLIEKKAPNAQEAIIGVSFILASSLALLLLADNPHGGQETQHLLSGQILFISWHDVINHLPVYAVIIGLWFAVPKVRSGIWFYVLFAFAITSSVQLVGVYVVFASLILPALASRKILGAITCGVASVILGIAIATIFDLPAGPIIVCSYVAVTIIFRLLSYATTHICSVFIPRHFSHYQSQATKTCNSSKRKPGSD